MKTGNNHSRTLLDKIWARGVVIRETQNAPAVLYVDLHLLNEVTSPHAFATLHARGLTVRRPDLTYGFIDHSIPTLPPNAKGEWTYVSADAKTQVETFRRECRTHDIPLADVDSVAHGIAHVSAPEMGLTQPGTIIVCGDSHTSTHGAFGALAFGIGSTEIGLVLATQCLLMRKPKNFLVRVDGKLSEGVSAKDLALFLMAQIGPAGGARCVIEYAGDAIRALSMEERMTLCNMSESFRMKISNTSAPCGLTLQRIRARFSIKNFTSTRRRSRRWRPGERRRRRLLH
jgi:3-isopropylmalate/(R)-2-methylmalate dehydratase large subunit